MDCPTSLRSIDFFLSSSSVLSYYFLATHAYLTHFILVNVGLEGKLVALLEGLRGQLNRCRCRCSAASFIPMVGGVSIVSAALSLDTHHAEQVMMERVALMGLSLRVLCHGSLDG